MESNNDTIISFLHLEEVTIRLSSSLSSSSNNNQVSTQPNGIFAISKCVNRSSGTNDNDGDNIQILFEVIVCTNTDKDPINNDDVPAVLYFSSLLTVAQIKQDLSKLPKSQQHQQQQTITDDTKKSNSSLTSNDDVNRFLSVIIVPKNDPTMNNTKKSDSVTSGTDFDTQIVFELYQNDTTPQESYIGIQITQRLKSGIVIRPWNTKLHSRFESTTDESKPKLSIHTFLHRWVQNHYTLSNQIREQYDKQREIENGRNAWKDTALQLEQKYWIEEKNELLENFLRLYQAKHKLVQQHEETIQQLQQRIEQLENDITNNQQSKKTTTTKRKRTKKEVNDDADDDENYDDVYQDLPDDYDNKEDEIYNPDLIAALAAGPKGNSKTKKTTMDKGAPATKRGRRPTKKDTKLEENDDTEEQLQSATTTIRRPQRKRRNVTTGAIEYYDTNALFEDETLFQKNTDSNVTTTTANTATTSNKSEIYVKKEFKRDDDSTNNIIAKKNNRRRSASTSSSSSASLDGVQRMKVLLPKQTKSEEAEVAKVQVVTKPQPKDDSDNDEISIRKANITEKVDIKRNTKKKVVDSDDSSTDEDSEVEAQRLKEYFRKMNASSQSTTKKVDETVKDQPIVKKHIIKTNKGDDDNDDDDNSIDHALQADILAQLEAMKEG